VLQAEEFDGFLLHDGIIPKNGRIWLGANLPLQTRITNALHASATGGHSSFPVTYPRIKQLFAWPLMKQSIRKQVQSCLVCQQAKPERVRYPGLFQPLPVPNHAWEVISTDFVEGFPKSGRFNVVLVIVDKFSRYAHLYPSPILILLPVLPASSSIISSNCTACQNRSSLIEIVYSQVLSGGSFSASREPNFVSVPHTIHRLTVRLKEATNRLKHISVVLLKLVHSNGLVGCLLLSIGIIPIGTRH
jgi:hypothetical protein